MRRALKAIRVLVLLLLTGCAAGQVGTGLVTSGETLKAVGTEFIAVDRVYLQGCAAKTIAPADCASFRAFGLRFKQGFPLAYGVWEAARTANDTAATTKAQAVIGKLATDLSALAIQALTTMGGK